MPLKGLIRELQDIKDGFESISRRNFEVKIFPLQRARSQSAVLDESTYRASTSLVQQGCWANMPPELLRDVLQRVEESEGVWPNRKNVVACAAVCRTWRDIALDLVKTLEQSGKFTFPISLKQPGPRDFMVQCFIKRDRTASTYYLYLGLSANLAENGKFLYAARRFRRATSTDYVISLDANDTSQGSNAYVGKLRSNFLATKFTVYDSQFADNRLVSSIYPAGNRISSKLPSARAPTSCNVAHIVYELNVLGVRGPRRMHCTLDSIPISSMEEGGSAPTPMVRPPELSRLVGDSDVVQFEQTLVPGLKNSPLVLKNKSPRWHEQLQCWCLNFRGRVTVASVKNFQLVADLQPSQLASPSEYDKVLLQFGKVGKDTFTMDYQYPLSAFQAFAVCLSSFDTKLACE